MSSQPRDLLVNIRKSLSQNEYRQVVLLCQELELEVEEYAGLNDLEVAEVFDSCAEFYTIFMLSLLIEASLNEAKYLWKRCPQSLKSNQNDLFCQLWEVGKIMWGSDIAAAVVAASKTSTSFHQHPMAEHLLKLQATVFASLLQTLSTLYTKVPASLVANMVGINNGEALKTELTKINWMIDENGLVKNNDPNILTAAEEKLYSSLEKNMNTMEKMAQYVAFLQRSSLKVDLSNKDTKPQTPSTPPPMSRR